MHILNDSSHRLFPPTPAHLKNSTAHTLRVHRCGTTCTTAARCPVPGSCGRCRIKPRAGAEPCTTVRPERLALPAAVPAGRELCPVPLPPLRRASSALTGLKASQKRAHQLSAFLRRDLNPLQPQSPVRFPQHDGTNTAMSRSLASLLSTRFQSPPFPEQHLRGEKENKTQPRNPSCPEPAFSPTFPTTLTGAFSLGSAGYLLLPPMQTGTAGGFAPLSLKPGQRGSTQKHQRRKQERDGTAGHSLRGGNRSTSRTAGTGVSRMATGTMQRNGASIWKALSTLPDISVRDTKYSGISLSRNTTAAKPHSPGSPCGGLWRNTPLLQAASAAFSLRTAPVSPLSLAALNQLGKGSRSQWLAVGERGTPTALGPAASSQRTEASGSTSTRRYWKKTPHSKILLYA